ncbi:hypothetical protein Poli38472_004884 [Pythium oligandrum]|uniref:Uncharacterized protein n=1 Tax=Pythium oligandrum TaxID=41045 RepID=A0A8K1CB14_PYTOL|nr:hypothetical protein Poli38472_004884 [Pythium oligandrum]|eukprot:TMW59815.1 hypothetical protein Poli38472_004884 [Pythium oligandrum]
MTLASDAADANVTLEALLAFVDDFAEGYAGPDASFEPLLAEINSVHEPVDVSSDSRLVSDDKPTRRRRTTRKEQITELQTTADALESKLNALKGGEYAAEGSTARGNSELSEEGAGWESVAHRQRQQRAEVETENAQLRKHVQEQLRMSQTLERLIKKRFRSHAMLTQFENKSNKRRRPARPTSRVYSQEVKEELLATVDEMYTEIETVFTDPRFDQQSGIEPLNLTEFRKGSKDGTTCIEYLRASKLPFDFHLTSDVIYDVFLSNKESRVWSTREKIDDSDKVSTDIGDGKVETPDGDRAFHVKLVSRRFSEPSRVVVLATMAMEVTRMNGKDVTGFFLRTRVWHLVKPTGQGMTSWKSIHVISPDAIRKKDDNAQNRRLFVEASHMLAHGVQANLHNSSQAIENVLMDRMASMKL